MGDRSRLQYGQTWQWQAGEIANGSSLDARFESECFRGQLERTKPVRRRNLLEHQVWRKRNALQMAHSLESPDECLRGKQPVASQKRVPFTFRRNPTFLLTV